MIAVGPSPSTSDQSRILILVHLSAFGRSEYILDSPWKSRRISTRFIVLRLPKIALVLKFRRTAAHYKGRPAGYTRIGPSPQAQPANGGPESYRNQMSNDWGAIYELTPTGMETFGSIEVGITGSVALIVHRTVATWHLPR
jgi:hypothetical protein